MVSRGGHAHDAALQGRRGQVGARCCTWPRAVVISAGDHSRRMPLASRRAVTHCQQTESCSRRLTARISCAGSCLYRSRDCQWASFDAVFAAHAGAVASASLADGRCGPTSAPHALRGCHLRFSVVYLPPSDCFPDGLFVLACGLPLAV